MNRKQFLVLLTALVVFIVAGAGVVVSERSRTGADARIGQKLIAGLSIADVAEIRIEGAEAALRLKRVPAGWRLVEPADLPANAERVGALLLSLQQAKVLQTEAVHENLRAALRLREPKDADGGGTRLELKDASGKTSAQLLLGKIVLRPPAASANGSGTPAGRYVLVGAERSAALVVSDPLLQAEANADGWIVRAPLPR